VRIGESVHQPLSALASSEKRRRPAGFSERKKLLGDRLVDVYPQDKVLPPQALGNVVPWRREGNGDFGAVRKGKFALNGNFPARCQQRKGEVL